MAGDETASMFAGQPQPVEIHHRGIWYSGELMGWRHESGGRVSARVRCRVDGLRHSAWMDLADLRLPDPARPPRKEPFPAVVRQPSVSWAGGDEDDATRPDPLLASLRTRAAKPAHAVRPPARTATEPLRPAEPVAATAEPAQDPALRPNRYPSEYEAYLSTV